MKLTPIIEELRLSCPSFENRVFGVGQYAQIEESMSFDLPAAFVLPMSEDSEPLNAQNRYNQDVEFNFSVAVLVSTGEDESGADAWDRFDDLKDEVFKAILGFDDLDKADWITYEGLSIQSLNRAFMSVQLEFKMAYLINEEMTRHGGDIERLERFERLHGTVDVQPQDGEPEAEFEINLK